MRKVLALEGSRAGSCPEATVGRTQLHLAKILQQQNKNLEEAEKLAKISRKTLQLLIKAQSLEALKDVKDEHELALFDHLQHVFEGRFLGKHILAYLS